MSVNLGFIVPSFFTIEKVNLMLHFCDLSKLSVNSEIIELLTLMQVIDFELPITVKLTVVEVDPGLKGDTAQGSSLFPFFSRFSFSLRFRVEQE